MNATKTQLASLQNRLKEVDSMMQFIVSEVTNIKNELSNLQQHLTTAPPNQQNIQMETDSNVSIHLHAPTESNSTTIVINRPQAPAAETNNNAVENFMKENDYVIVYIAGIIRTPRQCGIGVWFAPNNGLNFSEIIDGPMTDNRAELMACLNALQILREKQITKVKIFTCNDFLAKCIKQNWIGGWLQNNWRTQGGSVVKNKDILVKIADIKREFIDLECSFLGNYIHCREMDEAKTLANSAVC